MESEEQTKSVLLHATRKQNDYRRVRDNSRQPPASQHMQQNARMKNTLDRTETSRLHGKSTNDAKVLVQLPQFISQWSLPSTHVFAFHCSTTLSHKRQNSPPQKGMEACRSVSFYGQNSFISNPFGKLPIPLTLQLKHLARSMAMSACRYLSFLYLLCRVRDSERDENTRNRIVSTNDYNPNSNNNKAAAFRV